MRAAACLLLLLALESCGPVRETTLANGLKVVVMEDHRAPVVVSQLWYRVGGQDEPEGLTGISHVLEHMMFKGTERYGPNEFSRIIAANGGRENAFTGKDFTVYFQQLEKSRLPISFELEADRMQNLVLDDAEFQKEIKVVMEERRLRTDDKPENRVYEEFMATAFRAHPYKHPIIGWMKDLENMTIDDLKKWYAQWYAPNNATLVVVGDVKASEVFTLAEKYFGPVPAREIERAEPVQEPPQKSERRTRVAAPAEVPYLLLGYHVPVHAHNRERWEPYALEVLDGILSGGEGARFARELVRGKQVAASVDTGYSPTARSPTLFMIDARPASGRKLGELEDLILAQIKRLREELVSPEELGRVKAQVAARDVYARDSVFYQGMRLGILETVGLDRRLLEEHVRRIQDITAEQVREVARRYLVSDNLTVAELEPLPMSGKRRQRSGRRGGGHGR